jgi:hypothetical protein
VRRISLVDYPKFSVKDLYRYLNDYNGILEFYSNSTQVPVAAKLPYRSASPADDANRLDSAGRDSSNQTKLLKDDRDQFPILAMRPAATSLNSISSRRDKRFPHSFTRTLNGAFFKAG